MLKKHKKHEDDESAHLVSEPGALGRLGTPGDHVDDEEDVEETRPRVVKSIGGPARRHAPPGEVPAERDELGRVRTVKAATPEAASHWNERLWNRL